MADLLARGSYDEQHPLDPARAQRFSRRRYAPSSLALPAARAQADGELVGHTGRSRRHAARSGSARRQEDRVQGGRRRCGRRPASRGATTQTICSPRWSSATRSSRCSRRAATAWTPTRSTTRPICRRRTTTPRSIAGWHADGRGRVGRRRDRPRRQARHARVAAGQGRRPLGRVLSRTCCSATCR